MVLAFNLSTRILRKQKFLVSFKDFTSVATAYGSKSNFDLGLTIYIERHPAVICVQNALEKNFCKILCQMEYEKSKKSNYELCKAADPKQVKSSNAEYYLLDSGGSIKQSVPDLEEYSVKEINNFIGLSKHADSVNYDLQTKMMRSFFFVSQQNDNINGEIWLPPRVIIQKGESLQQASKRLINTYCGTNVNIFLYGITPITFKQHKYSNKIEKQTGKLGVKVFYYLARFMGGEISSRTHYKWINAAEFEQIIPNSLCNRIFRTVMDERLKKLTK